MSDPQVRPVAVGDGLLLFDPVRVRAHALNGSAALVWEVLQEQAAAVGTGPADAADAPDDPATTPNGLDAIVGAVATAVGLDPEAVRVQVADVLDHLRAEGLLRTSSATPDLRPANGADGADGADGDPLPARFANVPYTDELAPTPQGIRWAHESGPYRGIDVEIQLACDDAALGAFFARVLAPLRVAAAGGPVDDPVMGIAAQEPAAARHTYRYEILVDDPADPERSLIVLDGHVVARVGSDRMLAATLLWHCNQLISETSSRWLLHASGIVPAGADPARAIVFPAHMNSGKSTLVAGLVAAGHTYVTDETVAIDVGSGLVIPYPKAIALDPGSWSVLPAFAPASTAHDDRFAHDKWYCDVEAAGLGTARRAPVPLGAVVFPSYDPSQPTTLTPLAPLEAALALAQNSFNLVDAGPAALDELARVATTCPCYRLSVADLPSAVEALRPLLTDPSLPVPLHPDTPPVQRDRSDAGDRGR